MMSQDEIRIPVAEPSEPMPASQARPIGPKRAGQYSDTRMKSPVIAAVMSLVPGLGQCYVGYYQQGFIHILVVGSLIAILQQEIGGLRPLLAFFLAFFWLYNLVDAARRATFFNEALAGLRPMELPDTINFPSRQGSLVGGALMILLGAVLFAHTRFGVPLDWIGRWWPVAIILAGGYLIYKSIRERNSAPGR
jgi:TM2 domain-containing membrane protein YozV